jgi:hypothetical protein
VNPDDFACVAWKKSTRSNGSGECVEVAELADGQRLVRDSKNPDGAVLAFGTAHWAAFLAGVKSGEFDL